MNDEQVMHAMGIDDAYRVERVLARRPDGVTELVTIDGSGPFVRRRVPSKLARRSVWAELSECDCARLPQVEATYEMPDEFIVVCDYVPGNSLEQLVAARGRLAEKDAVRIVSEVCEATRALHARGIVHRDISPSNVIVAADGAHLIDLGIARLMVEGAPRDTTPLGTWGFAAPEQYGFAQTDARSDVYAMGRLLGYLLTGVRPDADDYDRLLSDEGLVTARARAIVERACAFEPSARYQSADELLRALRGAVAAVTPVPADRPAASGTISSSPAPRGHRRRWIILVAALVLVIVIAAVMILVIRPFASDDGASGGWNDVFASVPHADSETSTDATSGLGADPGSSSGSASVADAAASSLELVDSGWSVVAGGYVKLGIALKNNSSELAIDYPEVIITGRAADGSVVFSDSQVLSLISPGETFYYGGQAGNGTPPATVEFSVSKPQDYQIRQTKSVGDYPVSNVSVVSGGSFGSSVTGEVSTKAQADGGGIPMSELIVCVILRDKSGAIVYGDASFVTAPSAGQSASFEVGLYDAPAYDSCDVYAYSWY